MVQIGLDTELQLACRGIFALKASSETAARSGTRSDWPLSLAMIGKGIISRCIYSNIFGCSVDCHSRVVCAAANGSAGQGFLC